MNALRKWLPRVALVGLMGLALAACDDNSTNGNNTSGGTTGQTTAAAPSGPSEQGGRDQLLENNSGGEISLARNFYFVLDGSGSMGGKMDEAKAAIKIFVDTVPEENVNLGLFVFDSNGTREVVPLSAHNRAQFMAAVNQASPGGGTPLGTSIKTGVGALTAQYKKQLGYGEYRLIVVTDGEASDSISTGVKPANRYGIPIYTIGFGIGERHELRQHSVSYRSASNQAELAKALEEAVSELDVFDPANFDAPKQPAN